MSRIVAVHPVLPAHCYEQAELTQAFTQVCLDSTEPSPVLTRLHTNAQVVTRHLALPLAQYRDIDSFTAANNAFIEVATELGSQALEGALAAAGLSPTDVDLVVFTTITGLAVPSIDARIAAQVGLRPDVRRVPLFGLGCVAGAAGIARLHDYLLGRPQDVAVLISVELCSLTVQRGDASLANLVASGLFGDGAAAVVAVGSQRQPPAGRSWSGPQIVESRSHLYPGTERAMGWDVGGHGLKVVLGAQVPDLVREHLATDVGQFLADHELTTTDVTGWVSHPGGPKVIEAIESVLELPPAALALTWQSLARVGNLSSASVLHVLHDTMTQRSFPPNSPGVLLAMGPGFCSELVLLRWG
jgi:alkylresorcinol/alkylpyrone synthase